MLLLLFQNNHIVQSLKNNAYQFKTRKKLCMCQRNGLKQCYFLNKNILNENDPVFALHENVTNKYCKNIPEENSISNILNHM